MVTSDLKPVLAASVADVMESMFFATYGGQAEPGAIRDEPSITSRLNFHGHPSGRFGVRVPAGTGRLLAANFLGAEADELTAAQVGEVICEMANMLCGSVLSGMDEQGRFTLDPPAIVPAGEDGAAVSEAAAGGEFQLEEGPIFVWLELKAAG